MSRQVRWVSRENLITEGLSKALPVDTLLDLGCCIRPQEQIPCKVHICIEPFEEYVKHLLEQMHLLESKNHQHIILQTKWESLCFVLPDKSVDTVFIGDMVEHLEKEVGQGLIGWASQWARKQIIIFTPLGFWDTGMPPEGKDDLGFNGASWQKHHSGWLPEDFDDTWEIIATKEFYFTNPAGRGTLNPPVGAFWAIKTF